MLQSLQDRRAYVGVRAQGQAAGLGWHQPPAAAWLGSCRLGGETTRKGILTTNGWLGFGLGGGIPRCHVCTMACFCVLSTSLHVRWVKEVGANSGFSWAGITHALNCAGLGAGFRMVLDEMVPHTSLLSGWRVGEPDPAGQVTSVLQG